MHHLRFSSFAALSVFALVASCAGGREAPRGVVVDMGSRDLGTGFDSGSRDAGIPPVDLGADIDLGAGTDFGVPRDLGGADLGRRCVASCTTDSECQTSCPSNPTPTLPTCCDRATGTCFNSAVAMCPAATGGDGGMMMSM